MSLYGSFRLPCAGLAAAPLPCPLVVVMLYPVCAWFARVRQRSAAGWLGYL